MKVCEICGDSMENFDKRFKYCSDECAREANKRRALKRYYDHYEERAAYACQYYLKNRQRLIEKARQRYQKFYRKNLS